MKTEQKIYFQNEKMLIGSKVWEFAGTSSNETTSTRKKTIPVSAISSVDFVSYPKWLLLLPTIVGVITLIVCWCLWGFFPPLVLFRGDFSWIDWLMLIVIALIILGIVLCSKFGDLGKIEVITNNLSSSFRYHYVHENEASKYIEPMRECLLEKEG